MGVTRFFIESRAAFSGPLALWERGPDADARVLSGCRASRKRAHATKPGLLILGAAAVLCFVAQARAQNLVANGNFEGGVNKAGEPGGWHTRITSVTPIPEYADPANKKGRTGKYTYKCGCGENWGEVRPWAQLVCPHCGQMVTGLEDSGDWYAKNFECVGLAPGRDGQAVRITMNDAVASNQGVRVLSTLIRAERGGGYEISFDALSKGPTLKVFVECFRIEDSDEKAKAWVKTLPEGSNPLKQTARLKRVFRKQVDVQNPGQWKTFRESFAAPPRYLFDVMCVSLYAYYPQGEAMFDNVAIRRLSARETEAYLRENGASEERLREDDRGSAR